MGIKDLVDPLENAKLDSPEVAAGKKSKKVAMDAEVAAAPVERAVVAKVVDNIVRYQVLRPITISWGGQMIRLTEGTIVSDASHGDRAIEKMRNSGVELKVVEGK